jgi:hypothetical protein
MTRTHPNDCAKSPQLYIIEAGQIERRVALHGTATLGRDAENDIVLESLTVSRFHGVLLCDAAGCC